MFDLEKHYEELWLQSIAGFRAGRYEIDKNISDANDTRYGITLLARPSDQVQQNIVKELKAIKSIDPNQYYYPESDMHFTILSIISCYSGFVLNQINLQEYFEIIRTALDDYIPFKVRFSGLTASPSCIMIKGYPADGTLDQIRNNIRELFKNSNLEHSIDKRYQIQTAHLTVIRLIQSIADENSFFHKLIDLKERDFGECLINELELVGNDWYQRKEKVQLIGKIPLVSDNQKA